MDKAKRQLRAEAVERLENIRHVQVSSITAGETVIVTATGIKRGRGYSYGEVLNALIDLLTDDEPPERDEWKARAEHDGAGRGNDALPSENGVSGGTGGSSAANVSQAVEHAPGRSTNGGEMLDDTREKLEADVLEWCRESNAVFPESRARKICEWLDRQKSITELEERGQWLEELSAWADGGRERIAELERDVESARIERDECADAADAAEAEVRRLKAEVIRYAQDCGECSTAMPRMLGGGE